MDERYTRENFEELLDLYEKRIFNAIYRMVGDYEEAIDLTQETFVKAYQALPEFRGESQIYTWLYRIAINVTHNRLRQLERERHFLAGSLDETREGEEGEPLGWQIPDEADTPEEHLERQELRQVVRRAIQSLPPQFREVIVLRDMEGLPYQEIARLLGTSLQAVKSRLFRARMALKERLKPYLEEESEE